MAQVRRSGQCLGFDDVLPHRRKGSITIRCPACPEVHVNVNKDTIELAGDDEASVALLIILALANVFPTVINTRCLFQLTATSNFSARTSVVILMMSL